MKLQSKKGFALTAAVAMVVSVFAGVTQAKAASSTLTYGVISALRSYEAKSGEIANKGPFYQAVYDTLAYEDTNGKLIPNLALKWRADSSRTHWAIDLRKGVKFTDGTVFDGNSVKANMEAFIGPTGDSPAKGTAGAVDSVSVDPTNPYKIVVNLNSPDPAFELALSQPPFYQQSPKTIGTAAAKTNPIGTGPYILDTAKTVVDSVYYYNRNPNYWNKAKVPFDNLVIKVFADTTAASNALRTGAVDVMNVSSSFSASLKAAGMEILTQRLDWQGLTIVNRKAGTKSPLGNLKVRQAINYAINRAAACTVGSSGLCAPTNQQWAPYNAGYVSSLDSTYPYDLAKAKSLMADAGYASGFDITIPSLSAFASILPFIKDALGAIGIKVTYVDVPIAQYFAVVQSGKYDMFFMSLGRARADWAFMKAQVLDTGAWNVCHCNDAKTTSYLNKIKGTPSAQRQAEYLQALNTYWVQQAFNVPFYNVDLTFGYNPKTVTVKLQGGNAVPYLPFGISPKA